MMRIDLLAFMQKSLDQFGFLYILVKGSIDDYGKHGVGGCLTEMN